MKKKRKKRKVEAQGNTKKQSKPNQTEETQAAKRKREREEKSNLYEMRWSYSNRSGESLFLDVALRREKKGREGKKRKGIKRNWGSCTMQYYVFYLRKNEQREAEERTCVYTEIKRDEIRWWWRLSPLGSTEDGLGGKWQIGEERWRQGERNTTPRSTTITPTSLEENTG